MKELQAKAKVTQTMTRDGLVVENQCPEGKMCCGKTAEVRAKYAAIKEGAAV